MMPTQSTPDPLAEGEAEVLGPGLVAIRRALAAERQVWLAEYALAAAVTAKTGRARGFFSPQPELQLRLLGGPVGGVVKPVGMCGTVVCGWMWMVYTAMVTAVS